MISINRELFGDIFAFKGDATIELHLNTFRHYDPTVGRWLSEEPVGYDAGNANVYRYVGPPSESLPVGSDYLLTGATSAIPFSARKKPANCRLN